MGSSQRSVLLMLLIVVLPSIRKLPSVCGVISWLLDDEKSVVNSPTISSSMSSIVAIPSTSPYSSTTTPIRRFSF